MSASSFAVEGGWGAAPEPALGRHWGGLALLARLPCDARSGAAAAMPPAPRPERPRPIETSRRSIAARRTSHPCTPLLGTPQAPHRGLGRCPSHYGWHATHDCASSDNGAHRPAELLCMPTVMVGPRAGRRLGACAAPSIAAQRRKSATAHRRGGFMGCGRSGHGAEATTAAPRSEKRREPLACKAKGAADEAQPAARPRPCSLQHQQHQRQ